MQIPEDEPLTNKDQEIPQSKNEPQKQQMITGTSHGIQQAFEKDDRRKEQQQTLKALNKKLDSLHTHLERAKQIYATQD